MGRESLPLGSKGAKSQRAYRRATIQIKTMPSWGEGIKLRARALAEHHYDIKVDMKMMLFADYSPPSPGDKHLVIAPS